jgi:chemotaxis methyl-accepting protein methylase
MEDAEFTRWADLLRERLGLSLAPARKSFLVTNLRLRMREIGCRDFADYYDYLNAGAHGAAEWAVLIDRLTVHETRFFRDTQTLEWLAREFLPRCTQAQTGALTLNAWSAGCATGEEAYSLAIVLDQFLAGRGGEYYFGVSASDVSLAALAAGRSGIYSARCLKDVPAELLARYFTLLDNGRYQVNARLRERVCFSQLNLAEMTAADKALMSGMDIIFCQNVLIYFEQERRHAILDHLAQCLKPGGVLVLGAGEVLRWNHSEMQRVNNQQCLIYRQTAWVQGMNAGEGVR